MSQQKLIISNKQSNIINNFKHKQSDDIRTENQKILTQKITECLTHLNLKRIQQNKTMIQDQNKWKKISQYCNQNVVFACISGIPPFKDQFKALQLPGQHVYHACAGHQIGLTEKQRQIRALQSDMTSQAHQIKLKITKQAQNKQIIFVYHSFGTFLVSHYLKQFYQQQKDRIIGLIQLGAAPIRVYPILRIGLQSFIPLQKQNSFDMFKKLNKQIQNMVKKGINITPYQSHHMITSLSIAYKQKQFQQIMEMNRNFPKLLKLFIYGERDSMIPKRFCDEKSVYYCYDQKCKLDEKYEQGLKLKFKNQYGSKPSNIQEKFLYKFPTGYHSVHLQSKLNPTIKTIIKQYLEFIIETN